MIKNFLKKNEINSESQYYSAIRNILSDANELPTQDIYGMLGELEELREQKLEDKFFIRLRDTLRKHYSYYV
jgi:hypothetical protein